MRHFSCIFSHFKFGIHEEKIFFRSFFRRWLLLALRWMVKKDFVYHYIVCVHVCTCDRENEYMLVRNGLVNVSLDWGSWQLFIVAVFASPIAQKSLDYTFIDPTKKTVYLTLFLHTVKWKWKKEEKHTENEKSCKNPSHSRKITRMWRKLKMKQSSCRYFASYLGVNMHAFTLCEWMTDTEHRTAISISHSILPYLRWWLFL